MSNQTPHSNSEELLLPEVLPADIVEIPSVSHISGASIQRIETRMVYTGIIPPPSMMRDYENILPGSADRILAMAENQSAHRQKIESGVVFGNLVNARITSVLAAIIVLSSMMLSGFLALHGLSGYAIALVLTEIVGLTGVAFYRSYTKKEERVQKDVNKRLSQQKQLAPPNTGEKDTATNSSTK